MKLSAPYYRRWSESIILTGRRTSAPTVFSTPPHSLPDFILPSLWLPSSPDLNPVRWLHCLGVLEERVHQSKISNLDELKQRLQKEWIRLSQKKSTMQSTSGVAGYRPASKHAVEITNRNVEHKFWYPYQPLCSTKCLYFLAAVLANIAYIGGGSRFSKVMLNNNYLW